jgi:hypothetical protein
MKRLGIVALSVATISGVGWAGTAYYKHTVCVGLEEDYLNSMSAVTNASLGLNVVHGKTAATFKTIMKQEEDKASASLFSLIQTCGNRSAETATRKASKTILGSL